MLSSGVICLQVREKKKTKSVFLLAQEKKAISNKIGIFRILFKLPPDYSAIKQWLFSGAKQVSQIPSSLNKLQRKRWYH